MGIRQSYFRGSIVGALMLVTTQSGAVPTHVPVANSEPSKIAYLPFQPPLDEPIRYRWEKTDTRQGKTTIHWEVSSYRFEETDEGFRLTITPVSFGSSETDPRKLEVEKRLGELTRAPFVLELGPDGSIVEMVDEEAYWNKILSTVEAVLLSGDQNGAPLSDDVSGAVSETLKIMREMPREPRLAMLTESIQPALEFGETEIEMSNPIRASVASASPWGGTVKRDVIVRLDKLDAERAYLSSHITLPQSEFALLMKTMLERLTAAIPSDQQDMAEIEAKLGKMKFDHETRSTHEVSTVTGLVDKFRSTETFDVSSEDGDVRRVITRTLSLID